MRASLVLPMASLLLAGCLGAGNEPTAAVDYCKMARAFSAGPPGGPPRVLELSLNTRYDANASRGAHGLLLQADRPSIIPFVLVALDVPDQSKIMIAWNVDEPIQDVRLVGPAEITVQAHSCQPVDLEVRPNRAAAGRHSLVDPEIEKPFPGGTATQNVAIEFQ